MSMRQTLQLMEMQHELNRLRAEHFVMMQRLEEAQTFLRQCHEDMRRSQQVVMAIPYPVPYTHPAAIRAEKRRNAYEVAEYVYKVMSGDAPLR